MMRKRKQEEPPRVPSVADGPSDAVRAAIKAAPKKEAEPDKLDELRKLVRNARILAVEIGEKEEEVSRLKERYERARTDVIPTFMVENNIPSITLGAEGNYPPYECVAKPYYRANIAADWEPKRREEAFEYLESLGEGDLIKTSVTFYFSREESGMVAPFLKAVRKLKFLVDVVAYVGKGKARRKIKRREKVLVPPAVVERTVQWNTLSAWLRRKVEGEGVVPKLEKIGGAMGTIADISEVEVKEVPRQVAGQ